MVSRGGAGAPVLAEVWRRLRRRVRSFCLRGAEGLTLLELVIVLALMSVALATLLELLSTSVRAEGAVRRRVGAEVVASQQLERVKQAAFDPAVSATPGPAYSSLPSSYTVQGDDFTVSTTGVIVAQGVQLVTVTASFRSTPVATLETYKVNR